MRLRRAVLVALGVAALTAVSSPAAQGAGCTASGLRVDDGASTFEPTRANPAVFPCADDFDESVRETVTVAGGALTVRGSSLNAVSRAEYFPPDAHVFAAASSTVQDVTITSGTTTITAYGLRSYVNIACQPIHFCLVFADGDTIVAGLAINGVGVGLGPGQRADIPLPGVGTLHVNYRSAFTDPPPLTNRALWLEGEPGKPDVVVAEAGATGGGPTF